MPNFGVLNAVMNIQPLVDQLQAVIATYEHMAPRAKYQDLSDLPKHERQSLVTRSVAVVHRIAGPKSVYAAEIQRIFVGLPPLSEHTTSVLGVVKALLADIEAGYIQALVDLVHAETFGDFLEMADHLLSTGYKDAAAVIAGSALEAHLRTLCAKHGLSTETVKADGAVVPRKADALNSELANADIYSKLDQKSVTAWLDLRNKAAHGKYTEYVTEQVTLMINGSRDFVVRTSV